MTGPRACGAGPAWACAAPGVQPNPITATPESSAPPMTRFEKWVVFMS
jgi:hypothetical protein